jgi:hypothetical protein
MKHLLMLLVFSTFMLAALAQDKQDKTPQPDKTKKVLVVDASCGQCKFGLAGSDCDLAVRIDGKAYFVDGTNIDSHGDAHASDGFCNAIRKAKVQGEVVDGRFKATYFQLLPDTAGKKTKDH